MKSPVGIIVLVQTALLAVEFFTSYDTGVRQGALALTNIAAIVGLLWLDRSLRRRGARLSWLTIIVVLAAVWIDALGNFQHLYARWWWWDRVTHAAGGLAVTALFIDLALARRAIVKLNVSPILALWFGFLLGQFVAAMYEVSEWLGDWWFATERVRGPFDTPRDLFFNAVGGLIILGFFWLRAKRHRSDPLLEP